MSNLVGKTLVERYNVQEFIGRGGMAEVYKVWDSQRAVHLAMKVLHADLAEDKIFLRRFRREATNLAKLQHPHIVRFYGMERDSRLAFMLMDYVEGESLRTKIFRQDEPFTEDAVRQIVRPVSSALHYAHNMGLVHCDIKPANIMLDKHDEVRLADFGIARMSNAATATMVGAGTPAYMAPEQIRGEDPTPQTDIYALGILLFEMLTGGERPFTGEGSKATGSTSEKVRWEQLNKQPPNPRKWNSDLSPELEAVVLKCLEKEPKKRFGNALELLNAIELATGEGEAPPPKSEPALDVEKYAAPESVPVIAQKERPEPGKVQGKSKRFLTAGIALAGMILLSLGWLMGGGAPEVFPTKTPTKTATPTFTFTPISTSTPIATNTPQATAPPALGIGSTWERPADGMTMLYIPAGEFEMGSNDGDSDEKPIHTVYLDAYWMDETEVTNAMYAKCVSAGECDQPGGSYYGNSSYTNHPVVYMDWNDAQNYCRWTGGHLPTEAEWEKAARGGLEGKKYPWGDESPVCEQRAENGAKYDNNSNCDDTGTEKAGNFSANGYGLYDMSGNVWEWVNDWYDADYYANSPSSNPSGPSSGNDRVLRGGSWFDNSYNLRSANRRRDFPVYTSGDLGFRCSRSLP